MSERRRQWIGRDYLEVEAMGYGEPDDPDGLDLPTGRIDPRPTGDGSTPVPPPTEGDDR